MSAEIGTELDFLERERRRLAEILSADPRFVALRAFEDAAQRSGRTASPQERADVARLKSELAANRIFVAYRKLGQAITLLGDVVRESATGIDPLAGRIHDGGPAEGRAEARSGIAQRIVVIEPAAARDAFRTKVKLKQATEPHPADPAATPTTAEVAATEAAPPFPLDVAPDLPAPSPLPAADDLTRIRGITPILAASLADLGITTWRQIAAWTAADVLRVSDDLQLGRQPYRQNWIAQAALLHSRLHPATAPERPPAAIAAPLTAAGTAIPAARPPSSEAQAAAAPLAAAVAPRDIEVPPAPADAPVIAAPSAPAPAPPAPPFGMDRLDLLSGMDAEAWSVLAAAGVGSLGQIASWRADDVQRMGALLGSPRRIARDGWIEQAALLSSGKLSVHAARVLADGGVPLAPRPDDTPWQPQPPAGALWAAPDPAHLDPAPDAPETAAAVTEVATPEVTPEPLPAEKVEIAAAASDEAVAADPAEALPSPALEALLKDGAVAAAEPAPQPIDTLDDPAPAAPAPLPATTAAATTRALIDRVARLEEGIDSLAPSEGLLARIQARRAAIAGEEIEPASAPIPAPNHAHTARDALAQAHMADEEFPELSVGEADVQIISHERAPDPAEAPFEPPPPAPRRGRLRREDDTFDSTEYAAYRSQVEEASVEIMRSAPKPADEATAPPPAGAAGTASGRQAQQQQAAPAVRRFLKALSGE